MRADLAARLVAGERAIRAPNPSSPPDRVGEEEHRIPADRRCRPRPRREVERRLERLHTAPQAVREDTTDLRERAFDDVVGARQPEPAGGLHAERDGDGLVVGQHERRQPIPGPDPVTAADATLTLDGDAEVLQRLDVAAHRSGIDLEPVRDLATREKRLRLEELEELEQPGRRCEHARSEAHIEGRIRPIYAIAVRAVDRDLRGAR